MLNGRSALSLHTAKTNSFSIHILPLSRSPGLFKLEFITLFRNIFLTFWSFNFHIHLFGYKWTTPFHFHHHTGISSSAKAVNRIPRFHNYSNGLPTAWKTLTHNETSSPKCNPQKTCRPIRWYKSPSCYAEQSKSQIVFTSSFHVFFIWNSLAAIRSWRCLLRRVVLTRDRIRHNSNDVEAGKHLAQANLNRRKLCKTQ